MRFPLNKISFMYTTVLCKWVQITALLVTTQVVTTLDIKLLKLERIYSQE